MELEQRFELPVPPSRAWPAFKDVGLLVDCLPGASLSGPAVDDEWPLRFDVKMGPIAAAFAGSGRASFDDAARSGRFDGQAADKRTQSRVKGGAAFRLEEAAAGCVVHVRVDYTLTGTLAQFGRGGIVKELAGALTGQFAANLAQRLAASTASDASVVGAAGSVAAGPGMGATEAPPAATQPLSAIGLIVLALKTRWRRWMQRLRVRSAD
jgi:uncharacterized protein